MATWTISPPVTTAPISTSRATETAPLNNLDWPFAYDDAMLSFATGDFGNDGQMDLIASHGGVYVSPDNNNPDQLYINEGNDNHWVSFDLQGVISNSEPLGPKWPSTDLGAFNCAMSGQARAMASLAPPTHTLDWEQQITSTVQWFISPADSQ